jgi:cell division protein FtsB
MTKSLTIALIIVFLLLQYKLWFDKDGILSIRHLHSLIKQQTKLNAETKNHNLALKADVNSLKNGREAIEERARHDLGMIKQGEIFVGIAGEKS